MRAIYKRELKSFFHSFVGWLFLAATLFLAGIYFTVYNIMSGYPTISYVLQSIVFLFIMTIPILTMRVLSEERKYKTDQLILTAPVSVGKIVAGKYLALVTVLAIPTVLVGVTPLFLMRAGEFQTGISYASLAGFFLYGCLGLAIGLFLSSLTESVVIAAVLTFAALFLGYIMAGLCSMVSSAGTGVVAEYVAKVLYCFDMVGRFDALSNGYFQIESAAYYITLTVFVLFCTTQSIQKRRYSVSGKGIRLGAYSTLGIAAAAVVTVLINLGLNYVPDRYTSFDVTANKLYTLTEDTKKMIGDLTEDVTIHVLADEMSKDEDLDNTLQQIKSLSKHVKVDYIDPLANPKFYYNYAQEEPANNSLIVEGPQGSAVVSYDDIYQYEMSYATYQYTLTGYDGEGQIASAIAQVTLDEIPKFYIIMGHEELALEETFLNTLKKENLSYENLNLNTVDEIPEDAQGIILNAPAGDYSKEDVEKITRYLDRGGNALLVPTWTDTDMTNFEQILGYYGVSLVDGMIVEEDRAHYYQIPYWLLPVVEEDDVTKRVSGGSVFVPYARGLEYADDREDVYYSPFLSTSDSAFSKLEVLGSEDYSRGAEDQDGPFVIGLRAEKSAQDGTVSKAVIIASEQIFTSSADQVVPGYNMKLFGSVLSSLAEHESSVSVPVKYFDIGYLVFSARAVYVVGFVSIIVLPVGCLIVGLVIWLRRRRL